MISSGKTNPKKDCSYSAPESWMWLDTGLGLSLQHVVITECGRVTFDAREVWGHGFAHMVLRQNLASLAARPGSRSTALRSGATVSDLA